MQALPKFVKIVGAEAYCIISKMTNNHLYISSPKMPQNLFAQYDIDTGEKSGTFAVVYPAVRKSDKLPVASSLPLMQLKLSTRTEIQTTPRSIAKSMC